MNWHVLLHWMTHLGEGSWISFRTAVARLADPDADVDQIAPRLRTVLSDLGHADFFVEDSQRWHVLPPALVGLPPPSSAAVLTGGCTPQLASTVLEAARVHDCHVAAATADGQPTLTRLEGPSDALSDVAAAARIPIVENLAATICASVRPIPLQVEVGRLEERPNWAPFSFDFDSLGWVEGLRPRSACEFRPKYGRSRFYFHTKRGRLLRLDRCESGKRDVVYAAAMSRGVGLAAYDADTETLSVPISAPLPELYARAACLCSGVRAVVSNARLIYRNVPHAIAAVLLVSAGQPYPQWRHGQPV